MPFTSPLPIRSLQMSTLKNNKVYIFGYSVLLKDFDSKLIEATSHNLRSLFLRQRLNSHRQINIYALTVTEIEAKVLNEEWDSVMSNKQLKQHIDELGACVIREG